MIRKPCRYIPGLEVVRLHLLQTEDVGATDVLAPTPAGVLRRVLRGGARQNTGKSQSLLPRMVLLERRASDVALRIPLCTSSVLWVLRTDDVPSHQNTTVRLPLPTQLRPTPRTQSRRRGKTYVNKRGNTGDRRGE